MTPKKKLNLTQNPLVLYKWSHPFVERLIGTVRGEYLDQALFWNTTDLERKLDTSNATTTVARSKKRKKPVTIVGLDSGYVHDCRPRAERAFKVVVGRIFDARVAD